MYGCFYKSLKFDSIIQSNSIESLLFIAKMPYNDIREIKDDARILIEQAHIKFNQPNIAIKIFNDIKLTQDQKDFYPLKHISYVDHFIEMHEEFGLNDTTINTTVTMTSKILEHKVLNYTVNLLREIFEQYEQNYVNLNDLDNTIDNERHLTEQNRVLKHVTTAIDRDVITVGPS